MDSTKLDIELRPMSMQDVDQVLLWENDPSNWSVSENDSPYCKSDIEQLVEDLKDVTHALQARYIIIDKNSEMHLGVIDLYEIDFIEKSAFVGVLVDPKFRQSGIGAKALGRIEVIASTLGLEQLKAWIQKENLKSHELFKKLNYLQKISIGSTPTLNAPYLDRYLFQKWLKK